MSKSYHCAPAVLPQVAGRKGRECPLSCFFVCHLPGCNERLEGYKGGPHGALGTLGFKELIVVAALTGGPCCWRQTLLHAIWFE